MNDNARWYWLMLLIVVVVAGSALIAKNYGLKPGIDLNGGTTFVYEVQVGEGKASDVVDQVIDTLRKRVDPNAVMNLVWRRLTGNRFEVQMPAAGKDTGRLRKAYEKARQGVLDANVSRGAAQGVLRLPADQRRGSIEALADGNSRIEELLIELSKAHDDNAAVSKAYDEAESQVQAAQQALDRLGDDGNEATRKRLQEEHDAALLVAGQQADQLIASRQRLGQARQKLEATNISEGELDVALSAKNIPGRSGKTLRQLALTGLTEKYPGLAQQIGEVATAWEAYEKVKGPLDDPEDLKALMRGSGVLEFRIAAPAGLAAEGKYRDQLRDKGPRGEPGDLYRWFVIEDISGFAEKPGEQQALLEDPAAYFEKKLEMVADRFADEVYLLLSDEDGASMTQSDKGWKLESASRGGDELGFPAVLFKLNTVGGRYMGKLTSAHLREPMAIVLDDNVISAPTINSQIGTQGMISKKGGYAQSELRYLLQTLNAGSLAARVSDEPIYQKSFNAAFGADNLQAGLRAAVWALVVVAGFMGLYYMLNGLIANFALFANMVVILGVMSLLQATFTLPGIAGIVLTIGMAVDANVLIFERIREELSGGADVRPAVRTGYGKALATIIDANLTTLITCVVLGYTATAEVKGFAVVLGIGILATMFTALLGTRTWIELYLIWTRARSLPMMPTLVPAIGRLLHPNVNWVGKRFGFMTVSAAMIIASVILVQQRGEDMLDIEFRQGTQVSFKLKPGQSMDVKEVRQRLTEVAASSGIAELAGDQVNVVISAADAQGTRGSEFSVTTLALNTENRVSRAIIEAFEKVLDVTRSLSFDGQSAQSVETAPVYPIRSAVLGENFDRPDETKNVSEFGGGAVYVIKDMEPIATVQGIMDRIERVSHQPPHDRYGYRKVKVIGLDLVPVVTGDTAGGEQALRYRSVAIVVRDNETNYVNDPDQFSDAKGLAATQWNLVRDALTRDMSLGFVSNISPQISRSMKYNALFAIGLSLLAVVAYIWLRFGSLRYGFAAIVALVHDVMIALGMVAVAGLIADTAFGRALLFTEFKVDLAMVEAMLTIVGYSLNDTIVVFDRIRENRGRLAFATGPILNNSINQTISRTTLTSLTTILALITSYLFGGAGVHGFAFTMLVGVIVGTYSSVAIAAPIVLVGQRKQQEAS